MNSFGSRSVLRVGKREFEIYRLDALEKHGCSTGHLPYSLRILLENLLRREDGKSVKADDVRALTSWTGKSVPSQEIAFMPSRVLLQDFTGVPAVVDLAAMRDAMKSLGGDPKLINPLQPAELVIDHSVQVDEFGTPQAFQLNAELEFSRNKERYAFLRWDRRHSRTSPSSRPTPASFIRLTLSTWRAWCSLARTARRASRSPIPIRWSAPTRTPR